MKKLNKKGFTLIELLAVIVILAIVAAVTMTVVIPLISGKNVDGAVSSVRNMNSQIIGACQDSLTADIMGGTPAHGTFAGSVTSPSSGTVANCTSGTCTISFSATDLKGMNISGEMPATFTATMTNCNITSETVTFGTTGQFANLTIVMDANGVVKKQD